MKATGIIRRVDDLGRIVIPREIRRILKLREGDPMEIYTHDDVVIFKKYVVDSSVDLKYLIESLEIENCSLEILQLAHQLLDAYTKEKEE